MTEGQQNLLRALKKTDERMKAIQMDWTAEILFAKQDGALATAHAFLQSAIKDAQVRFSIIPDGWASGDGWINAHMIYGGEPICDTAISEDRGEPLEVDRTKRCHSCVDLLTSSYLIPEARRV